MKQCKYSKCRRRLKLTDIKCKACELIYCRKHRYYHKHDCSKFNKFKEKERDNHRKTMEANSMVDHKVDKF